MSTTELIAEPRVKEGSAQARRDRNAGRVPAVVYGHGADNISVTVDARELNHILASESGSNTLITLDIAGNKDTALARQIHRHPTKPFIYHVDFIRVNVNEEVEAEVTIHLTGEPEGVKDGGVLEQSSFSLTIKAKPTHIPNSLECDVSALKIGDHLTVADITLPEGVITEVEGEEVIATVAVPRVVEEEPVAAEGEEGEAAGDKPAEGSDAAAEDSKESEDK